jgi:DNA polymerase I
MTARYLLIDGHSLTYRAFFALPPEMATASGQVTNAVFGFTSMLTYVLKDLRPDGVLVAFDRSEPTFRHEKEPAYKAQRESSPEILRQQVGLVREVLEVLGIATVDAPGWEADDLIATAARKLAAQGAEAIIVTGDRDSYQLVQDPYIKVLYNKRGVSDYVLYDEQGILERTGVTPTQYPEYAALRGDPSDNLPGVPGVGEKTAAKLITAYGGLDGIFAHLDAQTPKLRESLAAHEDRARANYDLMLLRDDAPLDGIDLAQLSAQPKPEEARRLFEFLEFRGLTDRLDEVMTDVFGTPLGAASSQDRVSVQPVIVTATSASQLAKVLSGLAVLDVAGAWVGDPGRSELLGVAVVTDAEVSEVTWVPAELLRDTAVAAALGAHQAVRGHDIKPLMRSLLALNVDLKGLQLDTAIAAYLIDPVDATYTLAHLVENFTEVGLPDSQAPTDRLDLDGTGTDHSHSAAVAALAVHHLAGPIAQRLKAAGVADLYASMENPLVRVLARMEHRGVAVDVAVLRGINAELTAEVNQLAAQLREVAGRQDLNLNSPTQLRELLYSTRGLTPLKKTKTGFSTDAATLEKLREQWPEFIEPLLRHREVEKLRSTYGEGLIAEIGPDQRIHATFHQTVARTGRLSSDRPNLHNIPVRSDAGRKFRTAFIPGEGCELLVADYNQIELRCIAHLAQDPGLIEAFRAGVDIHNATAARVFDVAPEAVTLDQRSKAKMVSYGLAYGMEAYGLAQRLSIGNDEASGILNAYFEAFPNVRAYMDRTIAEARDRGYTETLFGRRRPIPELSSPNFRVRQAGERQAMNAGIQGLAADIFKMALVKIDAALERSGIESRLILQVHDEVLVEVPPSERDTVGELVIGLMRDAASLDVPLEVNVAWGANWAAAKG